MLASITPLGERGRRNRWSLTVAAYVAGSVAGGASLGALLGAVGSAARAGVGDHGFGVGAPLVLATVALAGLAVELGVGRRRLPTVRRQVDERWLTRYRGWVYGVGFGFQLGLGVVTIVTTSAVYVAFAAALLSGTWTGGLAIGATFGAVRSVPLVATAPVRTVTALHAFHRSTQRVASPVRRVVLAGQAVVASLAIAVAAGSP